MTALVAGVSHEAVALPVGNDPDGQGVLVRCASVIAPRAECQGTETRLNVNGQSGHSLAGSIPCP